MVRATGFVVHEEPETHPKGNPAPILKRHFPSATAAIKVTAEYFPRKTVRSLRRFSMPVHRSVRWLHPNHSAVGSIFQDKGIGGGWEMAFLIIGALGFLWMGFWLFMYDKP